METSNSFEPDGTRNVIHFIYAPCGKVGGFEEISKTLLLFSEHILKPLGVKALLYSDWEPVLEGVEYSQKFGFGWNRPSIKDGKFLEHGVTHNKGFYDYYFVLESLDYAPQYLSGLSRDEDALNLDERMILKPSDLERIVLDVVTRLASTVALNNMPGREINVSFGKITHGKEDSKGVFDELESFQHSIVVDIRYKRKLPLEVRSKYV